TSCSPPPRTCARSSACSLKLWRHCLRAGPGKRGRCSTQSQRLGGQMGGWMRSPGETRCASEPPSCGWTRRVGSRERRETVSERSTARRCQCRPGQMRYVLRLIAQQVEPGLEIPDGLAAGQAAADIVLERADGAHM